MIESLSPSIPVRFLCKYFDLHPSSYYKWKKRHFPQRARNKEALCEKIGEIFEASRGTYGSPRVYRELLERGYELSENTVAKYMKEMGLDGRLKKSFRVFTTDSNHPNPIADRVFKAEEADSLPEHPGELLAGDITDLRSGQGFIYLAVVLDLYNREVVGWSMSQSLETQVILDALDMAVKKVGSKAQVIFHSDRGSQYASEVYRNFMKKNNVKPSMSRRGNCYDNAYVESWFSSLKKEMVYRAKYSTQDELRTLVFEYIEVWCNKKRRHSSLGYLSPEKYKMNQKIAL